jgi:hypothetical protein
VQTSEALRESDPAVVARYLQLRTVFHDRYLARIERLAWERYAVQLTTRIPPTLTVQVRTGLVTGEGEVWPAVFLTAVDVRFALCVQLRPERVAQLGTSINGPQRLRQRHWEDWWGWETNLASLHPDFFDLSAIQQEDAIAGWYTMHFDWLAGNGLLRARPQG